MVDIEAKTDRYEEHLATALETVEVAPPPDTPLGEAAETYEKMAGAYLTDGRHFREEGNLGDALAAFAYGHAWLDAGARVGLFDVPGNGTLFTV